MAILLGSCANHIPPLITGWFRMLRGIPSGSQLWNGSLVAARVYSLSGLLSLNRACPAGVIGGNSPATALSGPTQAPYKSCLGAGPGGLGIFGTSRFWANAAEEKASTANSSMARCATGLR